MDKTQKYYLGLDFGTSSLKGIYKIPGGQSFSLKIVYNENTTQDWIESLKKFFDNTPGEIKHNLCAISISSQVGTYITETGEIIPWFSDAGKQELDKVKFFLSDEEFVKALGMKHPDIISYPLPRLLYLKAHNLGNMLQMPKEFIIRHLTGNFITDYFSMRGIAHPEKGYAEKLIAKLDLSPNLPRLCSPFQSAGALLPDIARLYDLPEKTEVYLGCNDFYAGLIGMGIYDIGTTFDISGTSEHCGYISENLTSAPVSGPYFNGFCSYGGTKASGTSCDFAIKNFGKEVDIQLAKKPSTPIFLPYLKGERAPIFDENARGVFFGIDAKTTPEQMAYSVFEGVIFSLYDIINSINSAHPQTLICGGGSAKDSMMNRLRAETFDCDVKTVYENDASALGASMIAMLGDHTYKNLAECIRDNVSYLKPIKSTGEFTPVLHKRFQIFKEIYKGLKPEFKKFYDIYGG